jgi:alanine dehydrogenase
MIVGVPNETNTNETRAAIIPPVAEELVDLRRNIRSFSVVFFGAQ